MRQITSLIEMSIFLQRTYKGIDLYQLTRKMIARVIQTKGKY